MNPHRIELGRVPAMIVEMAGAGSRAGRRNAPAVGPTQSGARSRVGVDTDSPLVLLVDDVEDARDMYAEYFEAAGYRVAQAVDGDHALFKVLSFMPAVVVMDLAMPILDGVEATREIKAHPRTKDIKVIVLTGRVTEDDVRSAERAGADLVLAKPCTPDALLVAVRGVLG